MPETTARTDIEQGLTRLAMLEFLTGQPGPWNGATTSPARWARYRGHQIDRDARDLKVLVALSFVDTNGETTRLFHDINMGGSVDPTVQALRVIAEWDQLIDFLDEPEPEGPDLAGILLEAANTQDALHTAWVNSHDGWLKSFVLEQTDRFDGLRRSGIIPDRGDDVAAGNTAGVLGPFRTIEGVKLATLDEAGSYAVRLEGILRHVHDLVKRGASLDEIDQGLHAARSADQRITPADRTRTEVDLEVDGKAIARAEEVDRG